MEIGQSSTATSALLNGCQAVAHAVRAARAEVITSHPTMPQLPIFDHLSDFCSQGDLRARYIKVESAYSALSTLIGAAAAGARTFTATSSQSLAQMHEMLHWAAGDRLPIVIANVNRALGAPWSIWVDHNDSLSQRDTGWMQFYASTSQEVFDTILQAYRLAEIARLPVIVNLDGFYLSHTLEPVNLPRQSMVDAFLPKGEDEWRLNPQRPQSVGNLTSPDYYQEFRYKVQQAMQTASIEANHIYDKFETLFGRSYGNLETYEIADAETVFVANATMAQTVKHTVREMRREGKRVGLVRLRMFRPFPAEELRGLVHPACRYIVLDRNISFGSGGILGQEISSAFSLDSVDKNVISITVGLGGRDVTPAMIRDIETKYGIDSETKGGQYWEGVRT